MRYYLYMLYSEKHDIIYKGVTANLDLRYTQHQQGKSRYTKHRGPWTFVFVKEFPSKSLALKEERRLKHQRRNYLEHLICSEENLLLTLK